MNKKLQRFILSNLPWTILLSSIFLSGCGFSLRGQSNLDLTDVIVSIETEEKFHPVAIGLKRKLERFGAKVVSDHAARGEKTFDNRSIIVLLSNPEEKQKTLSVDDTGRPLEYELRVDLSVVVTKTIAIKNDQKQNILPTSISARRLLVYDNNQLLAKSREREQVRGEIYQVLINQLIERIRNAHAVKH